MRAIRWLFEDRDTGKLVIIQIPNIPLVLFFVAAAIVRFAPVHGSIRTGLRIAEMAALAWWAVDEILRGVNPFRRMLGAVVLVAMVVAAIV